VLSQRGAGLWRWSHPLLVGALGDICYGLFETYGDFIAE
jgi:hypothetical protein